MDIDPDRPAAKTNRDGSVGPHQAPVQPSVPTVVGPALIDIDGRGLRSQDIAAAAGRTAEVRLTAGGPAAAARSQAFADATAVGRPLYGRATGVGANRGVVTSGDPEHALLLLRSHATSAGPSRSAQRVRAMLVVRLNQLAAGGSGVDPAILLALHRMIAADALPDVRTLGSVGTGDLSALATTALTLMGEQPTSQPLGERVRFGAADGLAFISSNAGALGDAALAVSSLTESARAAVVISALTFDAVGGNAEAYADAVLRVTPFAGAAVLCSALRELVGADPTGVRRDDAGTVLAPARIQDPFGLRAVPQVHGPVLDALNSADAVVRRLVNAPAENPLLLSDDTLPGGGAVAHHAGFHYAYLQMALDSVALAVAQSGPLLLSRLAMLIDPALTGLAPFLGDGRPGASGVMAFEYVAASALGAIRAAAQPAGLQSVALSRGVEEDASFASLAAEQCLTVAGHYRELLSCELVAAVRALRMQSARRRTGPIAAALELCRALPVELVDRDLSVDLSVAADLLASLARLLPADRWTS